MQRGVLIDANGEFLALVQWEDDQPTPNFNTPKAGNAHVKPKDVRTLLPEDAYEPGAENGWRWNKATQSWDKPTENVCFVNEKTGALAGNRMVWPGQTPNTPFGQKIVRTPLPARDRSKGKPIWNDDSGAFEYSKRIAIVEAGTITNILLEDPRPGKGYTTPPQGDELLRNPETVMTWDNKSITIGCSRNAQGNWERPDAPEPVT
jgi:hypothetical protein